MLTRFRRRRAKCQIVSHYAGSIARHCRERLWPITETGERSLQCGRHDVVEKNRCEVDVVETVNRSSIVVLNCFGSRCRKIWTFACMMKKVGIGHGTLLISQVSFRRASGQSWVSIGTNILVLQTLVLLRVFGRDGAVHVLLVLWMQCSALPSTVRVWMIVLFSRTDTRNNSLIFGLGFLHRPHSGKRAPQNLSPPMQEAFACKHNPSRNLCHSFRYLYSIRRPLFQFACPSTDSK